MRRGFGVIIVVLLTFSLLTTLSAGAPSSKFSYQSSQKSIPPPGMEQMPLSQLLQVSSFDSDCSDDLSALMLKKAVWSSDFEDLDDENWIMGWSKPKLQVQGMNLPSFELDANIKHSGQRSLKISAKDTNTAGKIDLSAGPVGVVPGETYTISFWIKGSEVVSQTGHMSILQNTAKEFPDRYDYSKTKYWVAAYPIGTYDWQRVTSSFTIPADQDNVAAIILFQDGAGTVWLDDLVVMPTKDFNTLPEITLEVETRTSEPAAPAHHYFLRNQPIQAKAVVRNQKDSSGTYGVKAVLTYCGKTVQQTQQTVDVAAYARVDVPLLTIDSSALEVGDYLFNVTVEKNDQIIDSVLHPVGLRLNPQPEFLLSMATRRDSNVPFALSRMDRLKSYNISPLIYGDGELTPFVADAILSRNLPFTVRLMSDLAFPKKKRIDGGNFSQYPEGLSDDTMWLKAAKEISSAVARTSHFPAFFPRIFTSDDFSIFSGWDWADRNKERFKQLTGIDAPAPKEFEGQTNPYTVTTIAQPKGSVDVNEPWLAYNKFLSKDVLGAYNKAVTSAVVQANPDALIGPIPGGQQWPLFISSLGQYPPYNFGTNGFNMVSYYAYMIYWRPELAYMFWNDVGRMNNRDLPLYVMLDSYAVQEESYYWNNFYLALASGVDGISYFIDPASPPEFWKVLKEKIGPVAAKFGSLFVRLTPEKRKVGLLSSFTSASYNVDQPLHDLCAFVNLMNAHVDVEVVSEEEILSGYFKQYDALVLSDVDWLRSDVADVLSGQNQDSTLPMIILDKDTEVPLPGDHIVKLNFSFVEGVCTVNYADPELLSKIRAALEKHIYTDIKIDKDTVVYRKYLAGKAQYLWLVNVHSKEEYDPLWNWATYKYNDPTALQETITFLQGEGVYGGKISPIVAVQTSGNAVVVDVLEGKVLSSSYNNGWTNFTVDIGRLAGKLIAFYPSLPSGISVKASHRLTVGKEYNLQVAVLNGSEDYQAAFPLRVDLYDNYGKVHPYSRFTATSTEGKYILPITVGTNAPKGRWTVKVTELSTGLQKSTAFIVN